MGPGIRTVLIDNYDSYSYNLFHLLASVNGQRPLVLENDSFSSYKELEEMAGGGNSFHSIVISPGPGRPENPKDFGACLDVLRNARVPVLGVCLGHQGICSAFGGKIKHSPGGVAHGKISEVEHDGQGLFQNIPQFCRVVRYHSLSADSSAVPACIRISATCAVTYSGTDTRVIMGVQHKSRPLFGVQFHPESICTEHGRTIIENFHRITLDQLAGSLSPRLMPVLKGIADTSSPMDRLVDSGAPSTGMTLRWRKQRMTSTPHDPTENIFVSLYGEGAFPSFWLDSPPDVDSARFSYMGDASGPYAELVVAQGASPNGEPEYVDERVRTIRLSKSDFFSELDNRLQSRACPQPEGLPFSYNCGYVGYIGYEFKDQCGGRGLHHSELPDAMMLFVDRLLVFDHRESDLYMVCAGYEGESEELNAGKWFDLVEEELELLQEGNLKRDPSPFLNTPNRHTPMPMFHLERDRCEYMEDVRECLAEIQEGETYEVCLTNRIRSSSVVEPLDLYKTLRRRNDAPYAAFLRLSDEWAVCCCSPERFLRVDGEGYVESKPIKGTSRRSDDPDEDKKLRKNLEASPKDRAENLMIVDLVRHDLGRTCETGSVHVPQLMQVESYRTVHQLVSTVRGRLLPHHRGISCLKKAFPMGSMTGAPKLRTMSIIDRLEKSARVSKA
uniref:aminodeoxychorismate synthase n=2 Tax=Rhodosorus marinus TaxID=101924 RepID=A0A7S3E7E3_9RHOD|mmetsp:Transcript_14913/g.60827  ORF Transcript_14913/g.60827 Transcript_14913/m.60827 type:complete len:671 (+) Transcript_14913:156-2168(+)